MKRILFMSEEEARTTLYCAGLSGEYEFYVVGNIERNQTIQYHPMCKKFINLNNKLELSDDSQALADELVDIIDRENIDILLPVSIACLLVIDKHRSQIEQHVLITPCPTKESVDVLDNKYNFYMFCKEHGIAHPESILVEKVDDINPDNVGIDFPFLIKPILGAGGFSTLVFVKSRKDLDEFLSRPSDKKDGYFPALIQEFFDGVDIDFNGFSVNGKVLASSVMRTEFYDKDIELSFTDFVKNDDVIKLGNKILNESGYSGPTNIDMRIRASDGKLMLIEVNPRYWARVHVSLMDGMNFLDIGIKATLNEPFKSESRCSRSRWISSLSPLLKAIIKDRKLSYIKNLFKISSAQIKHIVYTKRFWKRVNQLSALKK